MGCFVDIVQAVRAQMPAIEHLIGAEHIASLRRPVSSVVWVPSGDVFAAARQGGRDRSLRTQVVGLQAFVWGVSESRLPEDDYRVTDSLTKALLWAVDAVAPGNWQVSSGGWEGDTTKGQRGKAYVLGLTFEVPVVKTELRALVTSVQTETVLALPGGDETGASAP